MKTFPHVAFGIYGLEGGLHNRSAKSPASSASAVCGWLAPRVVVKSGCVIVAAMKRVIFGASIALAAFGCQPKTEDTTIVDNTPPPAAATMAFAPIGDVMKANCVGCHGAAKPADELNLTSYAGLMKGGDDGAVVIPGDPAGSSIVKYLRGLETPRMPLKQAPLPEATIQAVEAWIRAGAKE